MTVLGLDSALGAFSVALVEDGRPLAVAEIQGNVALEQGLEAVARVLSEARASRERVDRLAVGVGPGGFTGVRIAISYAKSLALGWGRPLTGVNSFDAVEAGVQSTGPTLCVVRGRPGVISVRYRHDGGERRASGYVAEVLDELGDLPQSLGVIGDAEDVLPRLAERGLHVHILNRAILPTALAVAAVAASREPARSSHEIRADYGELPAAKIPTRL
jgi:tRNA threonylcarbamoyl adenosine modification protein YeaZ